MTEELKHIDKAGTVENTKVVENTEFVESNDSKQSNKHWYVLRVMGGKEKKTASSDKTGQIGMQVLIPVTDSAPIKHNDVIK